MNDLLNSSHKCFPDLQGARYQSHHLCGIMYGRQVRHDRKILMIKAQSKGIGSSNAAAIQLWPIVYGHDSLDEPLALIFVASGRYSAFSARKAVWMCAYAYVRIYFITFLCTMAATGSPFCLWLPFSKVRRPQRQGGRRA